MSSFSYLLAPGTVHMDVKRGHFSTSHVEVAFFYDISAHYYTYHNLSLSNYLKSVGFVAISK